MHLLPPMYNSNGKGKRKLNKKQLRAKEEHEAWLRSQGLHKEQLSSINSRQRSGSWTKQYAKHLKVESPSYESSGLSGSPTSCAKRGILTNLHKESPEVQKAIMEKANRATPLFNKGGYQYMTDGMDPTTVGSRSRRG
jgi:hypothetical protein